MRKRHLGRGVIVLLLGAIMLSSAVCLPLVAEGAVVRQADQDISIRSSETIRDDLYVFGNNIDVEGRIEGDLIAFGNVVTVDGEVTGDVIAAGSDVRIDGKVGGSVRAGAGMVSVTGEVAEDVVAGSGRLRVSDDGRVGRDVVAGTGELDIDGEVARNLMAGTGSATIGGTIGGNADIGTPDLEFGPDGRIEGDLIYRSDRERDFPSDAVGGEVVFRETAQVRGERTAGQSALFWFLNWLRGLVGMVLLALIVTLLFPAYSLTAAEEIRHRPLLSIGIGLAVFFGVPIVATFLFVLGILIGGWWLALMLMALYAIVLAVGVVLVAVFLGKWLFGLLNRPVVTAVVAGLIGLLLIWLVRLIPIVGTLALWVAMLFGAGAAVLAAVDTARRCRPTVAESPETGL